jgi:hypothetical protein
MLLLQVFSVSLSQVSTHVGPRLLYVNKRINQSINTYNVILHAFLPTGQSTLLQCVRLSQFSMLRF